QNIMVGTVGGDIYYLRNGRTPIRPAGVDPRRPIPGNTSATEWQGIHPMSELVQIENPPRGRMQNYNCLPIAIMGKDQPRHDQFAGRLYVYNESPERPTHQRAEMVNELLDSASQLTLEQALEVAFCTQVWRADRWQARISDAWRNATEADKSGDAG